ncbi:hypothetical protein GF312_21185 [Candidatus Poribacteria bacterium]|nr:hypothetical protein [Candidatus Poribacteria bacterium]
MKRSVLLIIMGLFIIFPLIFWVQDMIPRLYEPYYISIMTEAARMLALVGFIFLLFQYIMSSRLRFIERGMGMDKLLALHRKTGIIGLILILIHPALLYVGPFIQGYIPGFPPWKIVGIVALSIMIVTAGAAILYSRISIKYETWKNIHRVGYVIFPLVFLHSFFLGTDFQYGWTPLKIYWLALAGIYLTVPIYRIFNRIRVVRNPYKVSDVVQESHDTWSLYFDGDKPNYKPGQFMIINLIRNGKTSESHPFTISASPTMDRLSISVKSVGDFTSTIKDTEVSDKAYIDAPYGVFSFLNHDAQNLIFIAGGIGITPFMSMLRYIHEKGIERRVTLIWGNKTDQDIVFREELQKIESEISSLKVVHVMSEQEDWHGEKGYVDADIIRKYVEDFQDTQFFLCGPPPMMTSVENHLLSLGAEKSKIHYEVFALR